MSMSVLFVIAMACMWCLVIGEVSLRQFVSGLFFGTLFWLLTGVLVSVALGIFGIIENSWAYLEISMGLAVLSFVSTMAVAHYIERERIF